MIEEAYVNFEVAKLLKEKEFDEPCHLHYHYVKEFDRYLKTEEKIDISFKKFYYSCPTLQMVIKWLTVEHNIYYDIQLLLGDKAEKYGDLQLGIYQLSSSGSYMWKEWIYADTYVELYENYIKYCLKNLI